jgi:hypothetical protein
MNILKNNFILFLVIFIFILVDGKDISAQTLDEGKQGLSNFNIKTLRDSIGTSIPPVAVYAPTDRPTQPQLLVPQHGSSNPSMVKPGSGNELIPELGNAIGHLPPNAQAQARADPKVTQCIGETSDYVNNVYQVRTPVSQLSDAIIKSIQKHNQDCLSAFNEKSPLFTKNPDLSSVGVLYSLSERSFYCTATLISNKMLITARHCAYLPSASDSSSGFSSEIAMGYQINKASDIYFYSLSDPSDPDQVAAFVDETGAPANLSASLSGLEQEGDFVFMNLKKSVVGISPAEIGMKPPVVGQQMIIPGFYAKLGFLDGLSKLVSKESTVSTPPKMSGWSNYMRYDALSTCKAVVVGKQCIFHACQTEPGWSGAPVFIDNGAGKLVISGIQSGSLPKNSDCQSDLTVADPVDFNDGSDIPNVATIVVKH